VTSRLPVIAMKMTTSQNIAVIELPKRSRASPALQVLSDVARRRSAESLPADAAKVACYGCVLAAARGDRITSRNTTRSSFPVQLDHVSFKLSSTPRVTDTRPPAGHGSSR
jgi:hypothetical protein